ncbi:hypothetical protein FDJ19_gp099 [Vibrio phage Ceto]|uniref:Uncharacterized protein n=1 Tax=Vibrio phage Ceto TaxID=2570300 RepID=A0A2H5BGV7_9CAUD|nr:hypothetical protein FDJ19_gp014 [Vibrio phage Ceto]YP_009621280.1 hypothetical protein FDJ19_gp099 [Vibrio phage Ceto]AUG85021.1 hypothetical protein CETO_14 [Vibrio phage Ceto]AUG85199.1 hypothetical protein CETO_217 [Vibrio phage Ceto]
MSQQTQIIALGSLLEAGNAKSELQQKVAKLINVRFGWRKNDRISSNTLQAVINLIETYGGKKLFLESELDSLVYANKAAKLTVFSLLCEALKITDVTERKNIMSIVTSGGEREFPVQVLKAFC